MGELVAVISQAGDMGEAVEVTEPPEGISKWFRPLAIICPKSGDIKFQVCPQGKSLG